MISELTGGPVERFARWYAAARRRRDIPLPEACCLSTVGPGGCPEGRVVLLKGFDASGFTFFTNTSSSKGRSLASRPRAALTFWWPSLGRQVRIEGATAPVTEAEADAYFATRPRASQLGAWASHQSAPLKSREELVRRFREYARVFRGRRVPRPPQWSGYKVAPSSIEFWINRPDRLHDRVLFERAGGRWRARRLNP